jgi:hypothetical protein
MSKSELIAKAIAQVNEMAALDDVADASEGVHNASADALATANVSAANANAQAEQTLTVDEAAASSAYDAALATARAKREAVRAGASQAVTDATVDEQTTLAKAQDDRKKVADKMSEIMVTLQEAADAVEVPAPPAAAPTE